MRSNFEIASQFRSLASSCIASQMQIRTERTSCLLRSPYGAHFVLASLSVRICEAMHFVIKKDRRPGRPYPFGVRAVDLFKTQPFSKLLRKSGGVAKQLP